MVLESLFNPFRLKKRPLETFLAGVIFSFVGLTLAYFVFREIAGILTVFLIVIATLPMLFTTIQSEEELDLRSDKEWQLLAEHGKTITFLLFLFLGITFALAFAYIFLPPTVVSSMFNIQEKAILNVNDNIKGYLTGGVAHFDVFVRILINNLKVLFFCLIFSFLYGTGAMFILTWNASVIAAAIGNLIKTELGKTAAVVGISSLSTYFSAATFGFFRYMTHGIFEIASYLVMALAGGIISIAIIKHDLHDQKVVTDILDLILISIGLLLVAGITEVYVTPVFFH